MLIFEIFLPKTKKKVLKKNQEKPTEISVNVRERDGRTTTFCLLINKWISQKTLTAEFDKQKQKPKINTNERLLRKS